MKPFDTHHLYHEEALRRVLVQNTCQVPWQRVLQRVLHACCPRHACAREPVALIEALTTEILVGAPDVCAGPP